MKLYSHRLRTKYWEGLETESSRAFRQMSPCASPCERCFMYADIQLFMIPREVRSIYTCCCCEQTNPTGQVRSLRRVLSPSNQAYAKAKMDHPCDFSYKLPGTMQASTCSSCLVVCAKWLPGGLFSQRKPWRASPPRQTLPSLQERSSAHSRRNEPANTWATWIYRSLRDQIGCIQECWGGWLIPFQGFYHLSEKFLL